MFHYEPGSSAPDEEPAVLTDPHSDYGLITLLATDGVPGLEVRPLGGEWTMVEAPARSLIVNLGDMPSIIATASSTVGNTVTY